MLNKKKASLKRRLQVVGARKRVQRRAVSRAKSSSSRNVTARKDANSARGNAKTRLLRHHKNGARKARALGVEYSAPIRTFEVAIRFFRRGNYERAVEVFRKLTSCSLREVADRARIHLRLCQKRMGQGTPSPRTAEEQYLCGIAALNTHNLDVAIEHLAKADRLAPKREHVRYALAAAHSLRGDNDLALKYLASAIELRPANRARVHHDEDFHGLADEPRFRQLLQP
jgi:tetratricopeptide (TPR) repeat protein